MNELKEKYDMLAQQLESIDLSSKELEGVVLQFDTLADEGCYEACEVLAELLVTYEQVRDLERAYVWYYVALKDQGYSVELRNTGDTDDTYYGDVDDFRNEAMVSELVDELGLARIEKLDRVAEEWLVKHPRVELR